MLKRLYTLIIVILVISVLITGLVSFEVINSYNDANIRQFLTSAAVLAERLLDTGRTPADAADVIMNVFVRENIVLRLTIVDRQGIVIYENKADDGTMDNHLFRPEIAFAFKNKLPGYAIRHSSTLDQDFVYVAIYDAELDSVIRTAMPKFQSRSGIISMFLTIVIVLVSSMLVMILIASLITRSIIRPLQAVSKAAKAMAEGHFESRIHQIRQDDGELSVLANSFNLMADRLQKTVKDLEDRTARLDVIFNTMSDPLLVASSDNSVTFMNERAREVFGRNLDPARVVYPLLLLTHSQESEQLALRALTGKKAVSANLTLSMAQGLATFHVIASPINAHSDDGVILSFHDITEAQKLQKMRREFVVNVSHELKTPLTSIRGFIETLRNGAIGNPAVAGRFLDIIDIEAEHLHKLISDILILSEIEEARKEQDRELFDLNDLIKEVVVFLDDSASAEKISLAAENADVPLPVNASRIRIKQILINLVDNAIKYNHAGGKVQISASRLDDGMVRLVVRDNGVGIEPEHLERIFERFYRVDKSRSREMGGTGLGLSIVKHIAQLYEGQAKVESQIGVGSVFTVILKI